MAIALNNTGTFGCQNSSAPFHCYGPTQIRAAYAIQALLDTGRDGRGKTITIVDAFQNPTMAADLATFDARWGLPAPPSFRTIAPAGLTPFDGTNPDQVGWSGEIALDVEWAHVVAPGAAIVLALAPSDTDADLVAVERSVINQRIGDVISMSFGDAEQCFGAQLARQQHTLFDAANLKGATLIAGSGDWGPAQFTCDSTGFTKAVAEPASDPDVTGVGGTELHADSTTGAYRNESVLNQPGLAGGGGFSTVFARPSFQDAVAAVGPTRGVPDVAYSGGIDFGVVVAWGSSGDPSAEFWRFGGTSAGAPQWSGLVAIADQVAQRDLGNINPALYVLAATSTNKTPQFHDITVGNNDWPQIPGFSAQHGWDAGSGLGSPIADNLVEALARP